MSAPLSTDPYKGVRDFYPSDWARMDTMFARIREVLSLWGYEEYNASPLERAELYEAKTSEEIVNEQTYTFTDRGDRPVTLRPEMTPTLARMVAAKRRELAFPLRWFSVGNRFRYERPQKGRLREFYQADIDLIGLPEGEADIEIVRLASEILKAFGASEKDFIIRISSRSLLNAACAAAGLAGDDIRRYIRLLDKRAKMRPEEFKAASEAISSTDPLSLIDPKPVQALVATLKERGVGNAVFDAGITRGFDYYTGMVFEVFDTNPANPRSLFGGGRYDGLVALWGGDPIPAVGFALGDVTLADFLKTHGFVQESRAGRPQLYLGTPTAGDIPAAQSFADALRRDGGHIFVNLTGRALGDQIRDAVKRGIPLFVAYGADEVARKTVRMKILATGEESEMNVAALTARLRSND
ncbi:MAG: Histidine-tRNA ligase [Parcubacteria group bacterium GW2011_GWB1_57_6]|nr:MAG: Histidine-tRNA ligase [Parcubacteria group bacterium GW2011_GWA1_56_13]KKW45433.1 MAG: Histidine-tRNA ligase [Parcubacteria group bacterium GW2011_GWB1_57_6]